MLPRSPLAHRLALLAPLASFALLGVLAACSDDSAGIGDDGAGSGESDPNAGGPVGGSSGSSGSSGTSGSSGGPSTDDGGPGGEPRVGWRSDWFDLFADRKASRVDPAVGIGMLPPGIRSTLYSTRFAATAKVATAGEHTFDVTSDDGIRVFVDGKKLIDDWAAHPPTPHRAKVTLAAGDHDVRVEYFQRGGAATLSFEVTPPFAEVKPAAASNDGPRPTFTNPVVPFDCPDPGVVTVTGGEHLRWLMVCTGGKMRIRASDDLVTWADTSGFLLPNGKAAWSANGGRNWAPEIHQVGSEWVAYFTAVNANDVLSIGCAHASKPEGPYTECAAPLVQHPLGVIDATFFEDTNGKRYLYYKIDGNSVGQATPIYVRELAANGLSFAPGSTQKQVLTNDPSSWEGGVVEAPWVVKHGGFYYLFYSGNVYDDRYRTGVARATSPTGPFTKKGAPILGNNAKWVGPGHGTVLSVHGKELFFHHAWPALSNGKNDTSKGRYGLIAPITWTNDWPVLGNGTSVTSAIPWP